MIEELIAELKLRTTESDASAAYCYIAGYLDCLAFNELITQDAKNIKKAKLTVALKLTIQAIRTKQN